MSLLFNLSSICPKCGHGHIAAPCRQPCLCRCRKCDARMRCFDSARAASGMPLREDAPQSAAEAEGRQPDPAQQGDAQ